VGVPRFGPEDPVDKQGQAGNHKNKQNWTGGMDARETKCP